MKTNRLLAAAAVSAISAFTASAQVWVVGNATASATAADGLAIGYDFNATSSFTITQLGAFDAGAAGLLSSAQVRVWQEDAGNPGVWANIGGADAFGGTTSANYSWVIAPPSLQNLPAGHYILSVFYNPAGGDLHGDTSLGDGGPTYNAALTQISLNAIVRASSAGDLRPDSNYINGIKGPNMILAVPEPETYALIAGLGLLGFGLYRRSRG